MYGAVLEVRQLPPGADLKRTFIAAMLEWIDAGWQIKEFSSRTGVFFCSRGVDRRMVEITPSDPRPTNPRIGQSQSLRSRLDRRSIGLHVWTGRDAPTATEVTYHVE